MLFDVSIPTLVLDATIWKKSNDAKFQKGEMMTRQ